MSLHEEAKRRGGCQKQREGGREQVCVSVHVCILAHMCVCVHACVCGRQSDRR